MIGYRKRDDGSVRLITKRSSPDEGDEPRVEVGSFRDKDVYGPCIIQKTSKECLEDRITVPIKLCCLSRQEMCSELGRELNVTAYTRDELVPFAVLAAHSKLGINKIVAYHSTLARSKEFVKMAKPLFEKEGFYLTYVDGYMSRAEQDRRLAKLRSVEKSLVGNCQLWREGVDVPEWGLVVLADPVKSPVSAKQIIGRASRPHANKETGFVFIPHIFDEETGLEVGGEGYGEFVTVFQAMMDDDPQLQRDIIFVDAAKRTGKPLNVTEYPPRLLEAFHLPESIDLLVRQKFISSVVMEMGGNNMFSWMDWYALLKKYFDREGDCLVHKDHVEEGKHLGRWVGKQRKSFQTGGMTVRQKGLLDDIGFCWDVYESTWLAQYNELRSYWEHTGHCFLSSGTASNTLLRWIDTQRQAMKNHKIKPHRKQLLDEIEFIWDGQAYRWERNYDLLKRFADREGHCNVPQRHKEDGEPLGKWLFNQMRFFAVEALEKSRQKRLEELGVTWNIEMSANERRWMHYFQLLVRFKDREGHCRVPAEYVEDGENLGDWLVRQKRAHHRRGTLSSERYQCLMDLGVEW